MGIFAPTRKECMIKTGKPSTTIQRTAEVSLKCSEVLLSGSMVNM